MLAIRLMRMGAKKSPSYRVVVKEKLSKRDGDYVENVGFYNPTRDPAEVRLDERHRDPRGAGGRGQNHRPPGADGEGPALAAPRGGREAAQALHPRNSRMSVGADLSQVELVTV